MNIYEPEITEESLQEEEFLYKIKDYSYEEMKEHIS